MDAPDFDPKSLTVFGTTRAVLIISLLFSAVFLIWTLTGVPKAHGIPEIVNFAYLALLFLFLLVTLLYLKEIVSIDSTELLNSCLVILIAGIISEIVFTECKEIYEIYKHDSRNSSNLRTDIVISIAQHESESLVTTIYHTFEAAAFAMTTEALIALIICHFESKHMRHGHDRNGGKYSYH